MWGLSWPVLSVVEVAASKDLSCGSAVGIPSGFFSEESSPVAGAAGAAKPTPIMNGAGSSLGFSFGGASMQFNNAGAARTRGLG